MILLVNSLNIIYHCIWSEMKYLISGMLQYECEFLLYSKGHQLRIKPIVLVDIPYFGNSVYSTSKRMHEAFEIT